MKTFNWKKGLALVALAAVVGFTASQIINATPAGKNAGWYRKEYPTFRPQTAVVYAGAVNANTSIYVPGIETADHIVMCIAVDSVAGNYDLVNLTDSTYVQDADSIKCGTATTAGMDLILMWQKGNY